MRFVKDLRLVVQFTRYDNVPYSYSALIFTPSVLAFFASLYFSMFLAALNIFDVCTRNVPLPRLAATHLSV